MFNALSFALFFSRLQHSAMSPDCAAAFGTVTNSLGGFCLNVNGIARLFQSSTSDSLVGPIVDYLSGNSGSICPGPNSTPACSDFNASLSQVITTLTSGCGPEMTELGILPPDVPAFISAVQQHYPTFLQLACLNDTSQGELCVNTALTFLQFPPASIGTLTLLNLDSVIRLVGLGNKAGVLDVSSFECLDCFKQAYGILRQKEPDFASELPQPPPQCNNGNTSPDTTTSSDIDVGATNRRAYYGL